MTPWMWGKEGEGAQAPQSPWQERTSQERGQNWTGAGMWWDWAQGSWNSETLYGDTWALLHLQEEWPQLGLWECRLEPVGKGEGAQEGRGQGHSLGAHVRTEWRLWKGTEEWPEASGGVWREKSPLEGLPRMGSAESL